MSIPLTRIAAAKERRRSWKRMGGDHVSRRSGQKDRNKEIIAPRTENQLLQLFRVIYREMMVIRLRVVGKGDDVFANDAFFLHIFHRGIKQGSDPDHRCWRYLFHVQKNENQGINVLGGQLPPSSFSDSGNKEPGSAGESLHNPRSSFRPVCLLRGQPTKRDNLKEGYLGSGSSVKAQVSQPYSNGVSFSSKDRATR